MNSVVEKEKKLNLALTKLKNLNFKNSDKKNIEKLSIKKNKLEIKKPNANTQKIIILLFALFIIYISLINHYYE